MEGKDYGRHIIALILFCILVLVSILSIANFHGGGGKGKHSAYDNSEQYNEEITLTNDTLELVKIDEETYRIEGEGVLEKEDLDSLFLYNDVKKTDIVSLIIGDSITELGYNSINSYEFLQFLKLGKNILITRNGAIRNNKRLQYVYIPKTVERIGLDFMYGSEEYYIITDGKSDDLPSEIGIEPTRIYENVHDYEMFEQCIDNESLYKIYLGSELSTLDQPQELLTEGRLILHPGYIQFGPYVDFDSGEYVICVSGKHFNNVREENIDVYSGLSHFACSEVKIEDSLISYTINLQEPVSMIEFAIINDSEEVIEIDKYEIYRSINIPTQIQEWFK